MGGLKHLLATLRRRALTIRVDGVKRVFAAPEELAEFLQPRTRIPEDRLREFAELDARAFRRESRKLLHAQQNVMNMMANAQETGEPLLAVWRHLDISKVPDDHDWPSILFALGKESGAADAYRREVLTQYLRFLEKRRATLDGFHKPDTGTAEVPVPDEPRSRDTLRGYSRLPHCRAVEVDLGVSPDATVFLGANRYHIARHAGVVTFEEGAGNQPHVLKPGHNTVGRSSHCDVHLENQLHDISRQHLVVDVGGDRRVSLMDVSSRGTYMRDERFVDTHSDTLADTKP